jgi:lysophospholipase L1-like esterase
MKPQWYSIALCFWAAASALSAEEKSFHLTAGDRVVFYGDSITDQRLYTTFAETYVVTRWPAMPISFTHSGWGGDRVGGGGGGDINLRLERDVLPYRPTVMTVMLGMNDGSYRAFDQGIFDQYSNGYQKLLDKVRKGSPGVRLTLIQPSPYDDVNQAPNFEGGYNAVLVRYGQFVKELAQREHAGVADLNTAVVAALEKAKAANADLAKKIIPDRVHPGPAGHLLMAAELLKAWNAPALVSSVEIDAAKNHVVNALNTRIADLRSTSTSVVWRQTDEALPMPVDLNDPVIALAIRSSDFEASLNQQTMKISGLTAAKYTLHIDGQSIGEFTQDELGQGLNLAMRSTPMSKQAAAVHSLTQRHNDIHFMRWRQIQVPMSKFKSTQIERAAKQLMDALDEEEVRVVSQQRAAARPENHKFELTAQPAQ